MKKFIFIQEVGCKVNNLAFFCATAVHDIVDVQNDSPTLKFPRELSLYAIIIWQKKTYSRELKVTFRRISHFACSTKP